MNEKMFFVVFPLIIFIGLLNVGAGAEVTQYQKNKIARFTGNKTTSTSPFTRSGQVGTSVDG